jgi:hypothetical protein
MKRELCLPEQTSKLALGLLALLGGIGLIVIGLTLLPVFGLVLAAAPLSLAYYFFSRPLDEACQIQK